MLKAEVKVGCHQDALSSLGQEEGGAEYRGERCQSESQAFQSY